jgi:hypothetical protein
MPGENHRRAQGADCRHDDSAMSGHPVHGAILRAGLHAANVILIVIVLVIELFLHQIEHERENDYEKAVVIWEVLATFPARERRCVCQSAHLVLLMRT